MKIQADQDKCIGAGQCVLSAPAVFDQNDDDGIVELLDGSPAADQWPAVRDAAGLCPAAAITLSDD